MEILCNGVQIAHFWQDSSLLEKVEKSEMTPKEEQNDVGKLDLVRHGAGRNLKQGIDLTNLSLAG